MGSGERMMPFEENLRKIWILGSCDYFLDKPKEDINKILESIKKYFLFRIDFQKYLTINLIEITSKNIDNEIKEINNSIKNIDKKLDLIKKVSSFSIERHENGPSWSVKTDKCIFIAPDIEEGLEWEKRYNCNVLD